MAIARRDILPQESYTHCTWQCLNKEFYLKDSKVKDYIVDTWRKQRKKYGIDIYDYCILDNHVHLVLKTPSADQLGNFMRTCNASIAQFINRRLGREGHALRERYKSPLIDSPQYFTNAIVYVWLNYFKATGVKPAHYKYSSAFYRARGSNNNLLCSYVGLLIEAKDSEQTFVIDMLNAAMSKICMEKLSKEVYEHNHTIGSMSFVRERSRYFNSLKKEKPY